MLVDLTSSEIEMAHLRDLSILSYDSRRFESTENPYYPTFITLNLS